MADAPSVGASAAPGAEEAPRLGDATPARCARCEAPLRERARFCGRCGAATEPDDGDDRAARPGRAAPGPDRHSLTRPLVLYFASLVPSLTLLASDDISRRDVDLGDLALVGLAVVAVLTDHRRLLRLLRWPQVTARGAAAAIGAVSAVAGAVTVAGYVAPDWLFLDEAWVYWSMGYGFAATAWSLVAVPALAEEIIFRGVILDGLLGVMERRSAIIVSAAMFATIHLSILGTLHVGALGLLFAVVRLRTGSLLPGVLLHAAYNGAFLLLGWPGG
ncbi:MAG: hypothetical protein AMXMBFR64_62940 [Myxococcales bacterium]